MLGNGSVMIDMTLLLVVITITILISFMLMYLPLLVISKLRIDFPSVKIRIREKYDKLIGFYQEIIISDRLFRKNQVVRC